MRTNIVLNSDLVERGLRFGDAKTKRDLVEQALREYVERRERMDLMDLFGAGGVREDYDYKALRQNTVPTGNLGVQDNPQDG